MKREHFIYFERIGIAITWFGLFILLLHLVGFFTYPKRIDFHETLVVERKDIPIKNKIAKEAAMSFGITEEQLEELGFVGYKWIAFAGAEPFGGNFLIVT